MGNGLPLGFLTPFFYPCNNLSHPHYIVSALWEKLLTKRFAVHDKTVNSMWHTTQCKAHVATKRIIFPCILATDRTVLAHNNKKNPSRVLPRCTMSVPRCFETMPWEEYRFVCLCQSNRLLLDTVQLNIKKCRHTAVITHANWASLALCQGFIKAAPVGRGVRVGIMCMYCLCVCLCCTIICISPFIFG